MAVAKQQTQLTLFDMPTHAEELAEAREAKHLSLHALARVTGVDVANLSRIERGLQQASGSTMRAIRTAQRELSEEDFALAQANIERGSKDHLRDLVAYQDDEATRYAVANLGSMTLTLIADLLDLCETTVDETLSSALEKVRAADGVELFAQLVRDVRTERDVRTKVGE
jgi:transcriptional regulator with XRE-family HTH domain